MADSTRYKVLESNQKRLQETLEGLQKNQKEMERRIDMNAQKLEEAVAGMEAKILCCLQRILNTEKELEVLEISQDTDKGSLIPTQVFRNKEMFLEDKDPKIKSREEIEISDSEYEDDDNEEQFEDQYEDAAEDDRTPSKASLGVGSRTLDKVDSRLKSLKLKYPSSTHSHPASKNAVKLYLHVGGNTPKDKWVVSEKLTFYKFVKIEKIGTGFHHVDDDFEEESGDSEGVWVLKVGEKSRTKVSTDVQLKYFGEQKKVDFVVGVVMRNTDGKKVRYPVLLTPAEKQMARDVCIAFKQVVCGFDLLRCESRSYVCDVNGWSFVKNSHKYYDDVACVLRKMFLDAKAPYLLITISPTLPWEVNETVQPSEGQTRQGSGIISKFGQSEELHCIIAVIRHGDRTPKQKLKIGSKIARRLLGKILIDLGNTRDEAISGAEWKSSQEQPTPINVAGKEDEEFHLKSGFRNDDTRRKSFGAIEFWVFFNFCFFRIKTFFFYFAENQRKIADYYKQQERLLEGFNKMETITESGCLPGSLSENEIKQLARSERMAIHISNAANLVFFMAKVYASVESRFLAVIASTLDSFLDLLSGFILWFTSNAMKTPNQYRYPIGKKRMQPVGIIVFAFVMATLGLQILLKSVRTLLSKSRLELDREKEKWMIGIMVSVTVVKFVLMVYCRRLKNEIVRAYAQHHFFDVITNSVGLITAVLAVRFYWWIDPTGAILIALYTMNTWSRTVIKNMWSLIGRTAPPEFLAKLTYLIWNHHEEINHIDTVRAYTLGAHYFVEVDTVLAGDMPLSQAHNIGETLQEKLEQLPNSSFRSLCYGFKKKYHYTSDFSARSGEFHNSGTIPKDPDLPLFLDPPRRSTKHRRTRRKTVYKPSPKRMASSDSDDHCSCHASVSMVREFFDSSTDGSVEIDFLKSPSSEFEWDAIDANESLKGQASRSSSCSCGFSSSATDIVIDADAKSYSRKIEKLDGFGTMLEMNLPQILTKQVKFDDALQEAAKFISPIQTVEKKSEAALSIKIVKEESVKTQKETISSPETRKSVSHSTGIKLRANSPRLASRRIQGSGRK